MRPTLEVADIIAKFGAQYRATYRDTVGPEQESVMRAITRCRTATLGGHLYCCSKCFHKEQSYNSCRNRHCPKCQGQKAAKWVQERACDLLPVQYFHTVFTIPEELHQLFLKNRRLSYELLFRAVRKTLLQVGQRNLGGTVGFHMLLHTWGQKLNYHPHVHVIIPGCVLKNDGNVEKFKDCFFISDKILSAIFRGKLICLLKRAFRRGEIQYFSYDAFNQLLSKACKARWVVKSKSPFGGPLVVLKYLARYTQRVAISNHRIIKIENGRAYFSYRDYKDGGMRKVTSLKGIFFIRRFMLHLLPKGFTRVRHAGFLSAQKKDLALPLIRAALNVTSITAPKSDSFAHRATCPACKDGLLEKIASFPPLINNLWLYLHPPPFNSVPQLA